MILDIDFGNTRLKWREYVSCRPTSPAQAVEMASVSADMTLPLSMHPERIRIASVRGEAEDDALVAWSRQQFGITPEFARTARFRLGLANGYEHPEKLGVDRWLAMLAAFHFTGGAQVVFDFGSAMTADSVDREGRHTGGYICPGLTMMAESLTEKTSLVRFKSQRSGGFEPGRNTASGVRGGVLLAAAGFANEAWSRLSAETGAPGALLTGGDADTVSPHLRFPFLIKPDLVLDGLSIAIP